LGYGYYSEHGYYSELTAKVAPIKIASIIEPRAGLGLNTIVTGVATGVAAGVAAATGIGAALAAGIGVGAVMASSLIKGQSDSDHSDYNCIAGNLWIEYDNMDYERLKNARQAYAGDLADNVLVLWDATFFGSADEGFLISKDLDIVSHQDKIPISLLNENPSSVLAKMKYFEGKDSRLIDAIVRLAELVKKYRE